MTLRTPRRVALCAAASIALAALASACRTTTAPFGATPAAATLNASDFFSAAAARFANVRRDAKFAAARPKLGRYALTPSKIFDDSAVWTSAGGTDRLLAVAGSYADNRYTLVAGAGAPAPVRVGDSRHTMLLRRDADDTFEWHTHVEFAVGHVPASAGPDAIAALASSGAGRTEAQLRTDYRAAFPRTAAALGRLFAIELLRPVPLADGSTLTILKVRIDPRGLDRGFPAFAAYVRKYVEPSRYHFVLRDRAGNRWFDAQAGDDILTVQARTLGGRMVSLDGAARPMPDSLELHAELSAKIGLFTVGVSSLVGDFTVVRTDRERGFAVRFRRQPEWHLPLASASLLRSPLRRPFVGAGALFRLTLREGPGGITTVDRQADVAVQESAILRFLGALGGRAMGDFSGSSEAEENRFTSEAFAAMRADVQAGAR